MFAMPVQALQRVQRSTKQDLQQARKLLHLARTHLAEVEKSGHPHPEGAPGFCPDVNRSLMAPVPSKPVMVGNPNEGFLKGSLPSQARQRLELLMLELQISVLTFRISELSQILPAILL